MMLLPLLALIGTILFSFSGLNEAFEGVVQETRSEKDPVMALELTLREALEAARRHRDYRRPRDQERFVKLVARIDGDFHRSGGLPFAQEDEQNLIAAARNEWQRLRPLLVEIAGGVPAGEPPTLVPLEEGIDRITADLHRIFQIADSEIVEEIREVQRLQNRILFATTAIFLAGVVIALAVGVMLARSVVAPAEALEEGARQFATGHLGHRIAVDGGDELAVLTGAFNAMAEALEKSQEALKELSVRDPLTGLFNHREIYRVLHEELERARRYTHPLSFLMLDLDFFKRINDSYGHPAGDRVLRDLARVIRRELRQADLVGRYGGEEFAVIRPETAGEEALELARRIHRQIGGHRIPLPGGGDMGVTVSIGMASFPADASTPEKLVMAADNALYRAKESGRNRVCRIGRPEECA